MIILEDRALVALSSVLWQVKKSSRFIYNWGDRLIIIADPDRNLQLYPFLCAYCA